MMRARFLIHCCGCVFACVAMTASARQDDLNARDAFWSASDLIGKRSPAPLHKSAASAPTASVAGVADDKTAKPKRSITVVSAADSGGGGTNDHAPLGLRYSVLKRKSDGTFEETSPDEVFRAGDRIRLSVMSNQDGYLYIIQKGTSGKWQPLYPQPGQADTDTKLTPGTNYLIPGGQNEFFQFSGEPGEEKLFVLLTRTREANLDETIQALRTHQATGINDQMVARLRQEVQGRDLVFTKSEDNDAAPASQDVSGADKATYVVNKATNTQVDPQIVVDVVLSHR